MLLKSTTSGYRERRGVVAPLVAISLVALMAILALVMDVGLMQDRRRHVQGAADAAALAAASDMFMNWFQGSSGTQNRGKDPNNTARASALDIAARNGYTDDGVTTTVIVNVANNNVGHINPSYPQKDDVPFPYGYVEVIITYREPARFSAIFGSSKLPVTARALARGLYVGTGDGVILLDPHASGALLIGGAGSSGGINVNKGDVIVNSDNPTSAGLANGSNAYVTDTSRGFVVTGGLSPPSNFIGPQTLGVPPTPDPLRGIPAPDPTALGLTAQTWPSSGPATVNPGVYTGWPTSNSSGTITLNPGIYIVNGDISLDGQGTTINGNGVFIYFTGQFTTQGSWKNGGWNITPMTTGPWAGIAMFQSRTPTPSPGVISFAGNGSMNMTGTFYAPAANLDWGGNGTVTITGQVIANTMWAHGNGNINITYPNTNVPGPRTIQLVE